MKKEGLTALPFLLQMCAGKRPQKQTALKEQIVQM